LRIELLTVYEVKDQKEFNNVFDGDLFNSVIARGRLRSAAEDDNMVVPRKNYK